MTIEDAINQLPTRYQTELERARRRANPAEEAAVLLSIAEQLHGRMRFNEAITIYEAALKLYTTASDYSGQSTAHLGLAISYQRQQSAPDAVRHFKRAIDASISGKDQKSELQARIATGTYLQQSQQYQQALQQFELALKLAKSLRLRDPRLEILRKLIVDIYGTLHQWDAALPHIQQMIHMLDNNRRQLDQLDAYHLLIDALIHLERYDEALNTITTLRQKIDALPAVERLHREKYSGIASVHEGNIALARDDHATALRLYRQAIAHFNDTIEPNWTLDTLQQMADVYLTHGDYARAVQCHFDKLALTDSRGDDVASATAVYMDIAAIFADYDVPIAALVNYERSSWFGGWITRDLIPVSHYAIARLLDEHFNNPLAALEHMTMCINRLGHPIPDEYTAYLTDLQTRLA